MWLHLTNSSSSTRTSYMHRARQRPPTTYTHASERFTSQEDRHTRLTIRSMLEWQDSRGSKPPRTRPWPGLQAPRNFFQFLGLIRPFPFQFHVRLLPTPASAESVGSVGPRKCHVRVLIFLDPIARPASRFRFSDRPDSLLSFHLSSRSPLPPPHLSRMLCNLRFWIMLPSRWSNDRSIGSGLPSSTVSALRLASTCRCHFRSYGSRRVFSSTSFVDCKLGRSRGPR